MNKCCVALLLLGPVVVPAWGQETDGVPPLLLLAPMDPASEDALSELCEMLERLHDPLTSYSDIVIVDAAPHVLGQVQEVLARNAREGDPLSTTIVDAFTNAEVQATGHRVCRLAAVDGPRATVLLEVSHAADFFRIELRTTRQDGTQAEVVTAREAVTGDPKKDARHIALRVGVRPLVEELFSTSLDVRSADGAAGCGVGREDCFAVGEALEVALVVEGSTWVVPEEVRSSARLVCERALVEPLELALWSSEAGSTIGRVYPVEEAPCRVQVTSTVPWIDEGVSIESRPITIRLRSLLMERSLGRPYRYASERLDLVESAALLGSVSERTNHNWLDAWVWRLGLVPASEIHRIKETFLEQVLAIDLVEPEASADARDAVLEQTRRRGDLLGYDLLARPDLDRVASAVRVEDTFNPDLEVVCSRIHDGLSQAQRTRGLNGQLAWHWFERCRSIVGSLRVSVRVESPSALFVIPASPARLAIPSSDEPWGHVFPPASPIFTPDLGRAVRHQESYLVRGVDGDGRISEAAAWMIQVAPAPPDLSVGLLYGAAISLRTGFVPAPGFEVSLGLFEDLVRVRARGVRLVAGGLSQWSMPLLAELNVSCGVQRLVRRSPTERRDLARWRCPQQFSAPRLRLGGGYDLSLGQTVLDLRLDWEVEVGSTKLRPGGLLEAQPSFLTTVADERRLAAYYWSGRLSHGRRDALMTAFLVIDVVY